MTAVVLKQQVKVVLFDAIGSWERDIQKRMPGLSVFQARLDETCRRMVANSSASVRPQTVIAIGKPINHSSHCALCSDEVARFIDVLRKLGVRKRNFLAFDPRTVTPADLANLLQHHISENHLA